MGWPDLTYRSRLAPELRSELEQLVALMIGWNSAEHGADGQHTTVTIDGLQFRDANGNVVARISVIDGVLTVTFPPSNALAPTPPQMQIGDVLIATHDPLRPTTMGSGIDLNTDAAPAGADLAGGRWCMAAAKDGLFSQALVFGNRAGNAAANVSNYVALYYDPNPATLGGYAFCPPAAGSPALQFKLGSRIDSRLRWDEINGKAIDASLGYTERGRAVAQGDWIDVPFNAANFFGGGGAGWTVDAGDVQTLAYTLVGQTLTYAFGIFDGTITGAGSTLAIRLPAGLTVARRADTVGHGLNASVAVAIQITAGAGNNYVGLTLLPAANWSTTPTHGVFGQITLSVT